MLLRLYKEAVLLVLLTRSQVQPIAHQLLLMIVNKARVNTASISTLFNFKFLYCEGLSYGYILRKPIRDQLFPKGGFFTEHYTTISAYSYIVRLDGSGSILQLNLDFILIRSSFMSHALLTSV